MTQGIKKWKQLDCELVYKTVVFDLYRQRMQSPEGSFQDDFYYIDVVDWVNVIAFSASGELILVEQYRFGIHAPSLELPGGMLHGKEDLPEAAARRELLEETGYDSRHFECLGSVHPNPAIQTNRAFTFLARDCEVTSEQNLDPAEDIEVHLVPLRETPRLVAEGKISHSLTVAALFHYLARFGGEFPEK